MIKPSSRIRHFILAACTIVAVATTAEARKAPPPPAPPPAPQPYLAGDVTAIGFTLPPMPAADTLPIERNIVLSMQVSADRYARDEAFADAEAYLPDNLMARFSVAAGETLTRARRPILAHILYRAWKNLDGFNSTLKDVNKRQRPFVGDPTILPCDLSYLQDKKTGVWSYSYPSGHAGDGYLAALILADVMRGAAPGAADRSDALMARGVRFGTNRMVCGVHYPSDVAVGQMFAKALYDAIANADDYKKDRDCAREEEAADRRGMLGDKSAYSDACFALIKTYTEEKH